MTLDPRTSPVAGHGTAADGPPDTRHGGPHPGNGTPVPSPSPGQSAALTGEVQDTVDPFDYAETIVRDLALHVGTRLRDFRADLTAMHTAVVKLPETMKINALGQSVQELRERMAQLSALLAQQAARPVEEVEKVGRSVQDLGTRLGSLESWIAAARKAGMEGGQLPAIALPEGGLVAVDQFDRVVDQIHDSILRLVAAVRELQLDLRDLRSDVRGQSPVAAPPPPPDTGALKALADRVGDLESRIDSRAGEAPSDAAVTDRLASLVFGAWLRLCQPTGADGLAKAVDEILARLSPRLDHVVRAPQIGRGSGLLAVGGGRRRGGGMITVLLAMEDLTGHCWTFQPGGREMTADELGPALGRTPAWRGLLNAAALIGQSRSDTLVVPIVVYGNGRLTGVPAAQDVAAVAQSLGVAESGMRLLSVRADDLDQPELARVAEIGPALAAALT